MKVHPTNKIQETLRKMAAATAASEYAKTFLATEVVNCR